MSEENVEAVRTMMVAFLNGDYERSLLAFDPEVEGDFTHMPEGRLTRGQEELRREVARWQRTWERFETEIETSSMPARRWCCSSARPEPERQAESRRRFATGRSSWSATE